MKGIKAKVILTIIAPVLIVVAVIISVLAQSQINKAMSSQVEDTLEGICLMASEATSDDDSCHNFTLNESGALMNGTLAIDGVLPAFQKVKNDTGVDVTVFYGDTRYVTTVPNAVGTKASDAVIASVLKGGNTYFSDDAVVNGKDYYAFYVPVSDVEGNIVGMVFAGQARAVVTDAIESTVKTIIFAMIALVVVAILLAFFVMNTITKSLGEGVKALNLVAQGDLTTEIDEKLTKKKDESGEIAIAIQKLQHSLKDVITQIQNKSVSVAESSGSLGAASQDTADAIGQVEQAVTDIAEGATSQANDTVSATSSMEEIGRMVENTLETAGSLSDGAKSMLDSSDRAVKAFDSLKEVNQRTSEAIEEISAQTDKTNESAQQIAEAVKLIGDIASETNLLSLNASIEAARAGEAGRGFAVVAESIKKLSDESASSAKQIEEIVKALIEDSEKAVGTMENTKTIVSQQNEIVEQTSDEFVNVIDGIKASSLQIEEIAKCSTALESKKNEIVGIIESLSAIAEENAATTEQTSASASEVTANIQEITASAQMLAGIADELKQTVGVFKI